MSSPFRIPPQLPAGAMKTYQILQPPQTHFRPATCLEVDCFGYTNGWRTVVDESTDLGQRQAHYIRKESRRKYTETRDPAGLTAFEFEAGQRCFQTHHKSLERPAIYLVRDGDWRGNPRNTTPRKHDNPDDWVDDFASHQQALADKHQEG